MSSTRRVEAGNQRKQNGWASAPEFEQLRGVSGTAVALKAALQDTPPKRELLYFIQALSLRDGGLKRLVRELIEMFPDRIGSPTMHRVGCKPGKRLTLAQRVEIFEELNPASSLLNYFRESLAKNDCSIEDNFRLKKTAEDFRHDCHAQAESLDAFLEEVCCNPKLILASEFDSKQRADYQRRLSEETGENHLPDYRFCTLPYFHDILGALFEFQRRYAEQVRADYAETSIGKIVGDALDYAQETGRSALIEGNSGFGKTTAIKAWHEMHLGQSRYVQLSGITTRGAFLKRVARACGVANGDGLSMERIQGRVEDYLRRTKLLLIIDEGQYLWPQGKRITTHPELINWINTALYNEGVPFAISATKQFSLRRQVVENQTSWSSEQLRRRTRKVFPLPDAPTTDDLRLVARKLLGGLGETAVEFVAGYAMASRGYFQTITDAVDDAQLIARRAGRERFTGRDLQAAVKEWRAPSDAALQRVFDSKPERRRHRARIEVEPRDRELPEAESAQPVTRNASPVHSSFSTVPVARETRPLAPALTG